MNRSLARSLVLGVVLLAGVFLLRAACVPVGPWETAVVFRGTTPLRAVRGPAFVWAVPVLEDTRVYDARTQTASSVVSWTVGRTAQTPTAKGILSYAWTWRIRNPLAYAKLGSPAEARRTIKGLVRSALAHLLARIGAPRLLGHGNLVSELGGLERRCASDGVVLLSLEADRFRWSTATLDAYLAQRKKTLVARLATAQKRDAAERALLAAREQGLRDRLLAAARRTARLARARAVASALGQEAAAARSAPSFFAELVRLEILDRAFRRSPPAARAPGHGGRRTP